MEGGPLEDCVLFGIDGRCAEQTAEANKVAGNDLAERGALPWQVPIEKAQQEPDSFFNATFRCDSIFS